MKIEEIQIPIPGMSNNEIYAEKHSLFVEDHPSEMIPVQVDIKDGEQPPRIYEEQPPYKIFKLFIDEFHENGNGIHRIINRLQQADPEDILELHISSRGGYVDELIQFYNLCDTLFHERVTTYLNYGYSAGALIFLLGTDRLIYEHSDIMFHSWSGGYYGKRDDMLTQMEHEDKRLEKLFMQLMKPYFSKKELKKMQSGKEFWLSPKEMLERGIATHIMVRGELLTAKEYLSPKKKSKKSKKHKKTKNDWKLNELDEYKTGSVSA